MSYKADVSIVGGGPVGKVLALKLAKKGWKVQLFEKYPDVYSLPRAVVFDDEVARILQSVLSIEELQSIIEPLTDYHYQFLNADKEKLFEIAFPEELIYGWPSSNFFNQPSLEKLLQDHCLAHANIEVYMGHEVIKAEQFEDGTRLVVRSDDGEHEAFAQFVVGADGANSFIRSQMNVTQTSMGFTFDWLVVDIIPNEKKIWHPMNMQLCDPNRPTTVVSGGPNRRRWEFMILPQESKEEVNNESFVWKLLEEWNMTKETAILERYAVYSFRALWADEWVDGRFMIAGDAAHLMPPFLGQGMCAGIRDADNLAWKLDYVLKGQSTLNLLQTYTEERKEHVSTYIRIAIILGEMICITDRQKAKVRDANFKSGNVPPMPKFPILTNGILRKLPENVLNGKRMIQSIVSVKGKEKLFDEAYGRGWFIYSAEPISLTPVTQKVVNLLNIKMMTVSKEWDIHGKYADFMSVHNAAIVIVRPDHFIFDTAADSNQLEQSLIDLMNQLELMETFFSIKM
ncbi:bifunctional 3-(3-hydroxy-phenyl)propionate/3-hydroxycinnamic acid hydroxylase [Lysinibacillus yapensis]|uniref:Bifunctional 3-(3-hydroxy-phenyl)propionate/3-hydroxycinnamic acid hydroxylase n=1 Tax=Ureibacillus yapensis TaxID=2304605 RepID=A0A396SH99_9BACL|nr:bifunctional 3-(3-hydroxy-phenyl)propionate/3-hydroxycinnamic acid hydroxylase [Lysinibacillus yapensis]RHW38447.1 bifunctional 3-(3-hydroxy-phenyl)propionate/3-hydroxycinnamic acid hydroxylase [Lysinibacillus yapensis]